MKNRQDTIIKETTQQSNTEGLSYVARIGKLRAKKLSVTQEKIDREGGMDEGDYGRHVAPSDFKWEISPNHYDGSFYGYSGWATNFESLLASQPVYVDSHDALAGQTYFYLSKMKNSVYEKEGANPLQRKKPGAASCIWNPDFSFSHLTPWHKKYNIVHGIGNDAHYSVDLKMGLELGWGGILKKLEYFSKEHGRDKSLFYESEIRTVKAIQHWIKRTISLIEKKLSEETNPTLKANLEDMRACNIHLLNGAPRTLKEACQWLAWFVLAKRTYNRCGAGGQLDAMLLPYYEKDFKENVTTREEAVFNIACLLLIDAQYYQLAGPDKTGKDQTSEMSYMILDAGEMLDCPLNLTIRVHDGLDQSLFTRGVRLLFKHKQAWPRFSGDKALVEGFMKAGYSRELANQRIAVGCNWMSLPGLEYTLNDVVKVNLAKVFEVALKELAAQDKEPSMDEIQRIYAIHLQKAVEITADGNDFHMRHQQFNEPELVTNLLCHGPVEKGLDMTAGGAEYCNLAIDGAGIAVVADSLAAIEQRVIIEKRLDWQQLFTQLKNNFEGTKGEEIRLMLNKSNRYGHDNKNRAMAWASHVTELWSNLVRAQNKRYPQYNFIPGLFSWANTIEFGEAVGATPNGRKAHEPINHGANPLPGFRTDGAVTAMANAISEVQCGYGNTSPVQLEMDPAVGESEDSIAKVTSLIKVMFDKGCTLLNINLIDEQRILEAHKNPSLYPDLVVRVTGFTSYFSMLSPRFRQLIVDRILSKQAV